MSGPEAQQGWNLKSSSGREGRLGLQKRLREKCLERVKKDRSKLMAQLRSIGPAGGPAPGGAVQMMETLAHSLIQQAQAESSSAAQGTHAAGDDSMDQEGSVRVGDGEEELDAEAYMQLMRQVEEDVIAELLQNEAADDRQLLEYLEHERQELAAAAAEHTEEDSTVCPVCMSGPLRKHFSTFYCPCGMRLSLAQDQLSVEQLRSNITAAFQEHGAECQGQAGCAVQSCGGYDMLVMACSSCDFINIVA